MLFRSAILRAGGRIVWADIDPYSGLIRSDSVEARVSSYTGAVVSVEWGGHGSRVESSVPWISDAAHRFGCGETHRRADYVAWSFQAIKFLTTGDGGALLCPRERLREAKLRRWFGLDRESGEDFRCAQNISVVGGKMHMNDIAASIGLANLDGAQRNLERQQEIGAYYVRELGRTCVDQGPDGHYWFATMHILQRNEAVRYFHDAGFTAYLVHSRNDRHDVFMGCGPPSLPGLDVFDRTYLGVPSGWWLSDADVQRIVDTVRAWEHKVGRADV